MVSNNSLCTANNLLFPGACCFFKHPTMDDVAVSGMFNLVFGSCVSHVWCLKTLDKLNY